MKRTLLVGIVLASIAGTGLAAEVKIFRTEGRDEMLEGDFEGISIASRGGLELSARIARLAALEEPYVFTAAGHPDGWVVGTGKTRELLSIWLTILNWERF